MQLCKQVAHFIQGIDFLGVQILQRLAVSGQLFVSGFHFWHELFHFSVVSIVLFGQFHVDHAFVVFAVWKVPKRFGFLWVRFYAVKFRAIWDIKECLHIFIVEEFWDVEQIVQEILQNFHSFFHMSFGPFGSFFLWDWRNNLAGVSFRKIVSEPDKVTVSSPDFPLHGRSFYLKLQERSASNSEESACIFSLRTA